MNALRSVSTYCIHASSFAAFIGKHPYVHHHEAFEKVWNRASPTTYSSAMKRHNKSTDQERLDHIRQTVPNADAAIHAAEAHGSSASATPASITESKDILTRDVETDTLSKEDAKLVSDEIRRQLYTSYGTSKESTILDVLRREMSLDLVDGHKLYTRMFETPNGIGWKLVGKIDAITGDGDIVVEVKNRIHRLFVKSPEYERIQCACYLQLVESAGKILLVEALRTDDSKLTLNIIPIEKEDVPWKEWLQLAHMYIDVLDKMISSEELQNAYMESKRPSRFLRNLLYKETFLE